MAKKELSLTTTQRDKIYDLKQSLESRYGQYQTKLEDLFAAYGGDFVERKRYGIWNTLWSKIYPWYADQNKEKLYVVVNLVRPIVEAKRGLMGSIPQVRVPNYDGSKEAQKQSDLCEKVILGLWRHSKIGRAMGDAGFLLPLTGSAVMGVDIDQENKRPRIWVRSTQGFYPLADSQDGTTLGACLFVSKYDAREAAVMWPEHEYEFSKRETVEVVEYWDKEMHVKIADEKYVLPGSGYHNLPFVPIVVIPNLPVPGSLFGDSDIETILELQKEVNRRFMLESDAILYYLFPPIMVKDPMQEIEDIATEPGGLIPVGEKGDIRTVPPGAVPYEWERSKDFLLSMIDRLTDYTETLRGQVQGNVITGKGVNAILGPLQSRIQVRFQYEHPAIEEINKMALYIWTHNWRKSTAHHIYGLDRWGYEFSQTFTKDELGDWFENEVYIDPMQFIDQAARVVTGLQLVQNRIISRANLRRNCGWVQDMGNEDREIKAEFEEDMQAAMGAEAMSQVNQNPNLNEPNYTQYGLERGMMGETPPMPAPGGIEGMPEVQMPGMEGMAAEMPGGEGILENLADLLRATPKVRGQIFLVGGILRDDLSGGIDIYLSDMNDKATIVNWIKKNAAEIDGECNYWAVPEGQTPPPPYLEVTPGTQGYEPVGGENAEPTANAAANPLQGPMAQAGGYGVEGPIPPTEV